MELAYLLLDMLHGYVFTTIFVDHKYGCSGVFHFMLHNDSVIPSNTTVQGSYRRFVDVLVIVMRGAGTCTMCVVPITKYK